MQCVAYMQLFVCFFLCFSFFPYLEECFHGSRSVQWRGGPEWNVRERMWEQTGRWSQSDLHKK